MLIYLQISNYIQTLIQKLTYEKNLLILILANGFIYLLDC